MQGINILVANINKLKKKRKSLLIDFFLLNLISLPSTNPQCSANTSQQRKAQSNVSSSYAVAVKLVLFQQLYALISK